METLQWVNQALGYYKTNEFRWVRELTQSFEEYFDQQKREFLTNAGFKEIEIRAIFLSSLRILTRIISSYEDFFGNESQSFGRMVFDLSHPSRDKEIPLNTEKTVKLYDLVTAAYLYFEIRISEEKIINSKSEVEKYLNKENLIQLENKIQRLEGKNSVYMEALREKQKREIKMIENMAQSYIETCIQYKTEKPTRAMLADISRLKETIWKHSLANSKFLYPLSKSLEEKMNSSRNDEKFWRGATIVIEKKLSGVLYRERRNKPQKKEGGSKQKRVKASEIKSESGNYQETTHQCLYCDKMIPQFQEVCDDCKKEFPVAQ